MGRRRALKLGPTGRGQKVADNYVVTDHGLLAAIYEEERDGEFKAYKIVTKRFSTDSLGLPLPWDLAGVYRQVN